MAKRAETYQSDTARKLRDPAYADAYMKAEIYNHGASFKEALATMIDQFGHVEFADKIDMSPANVSRMVKRLNTDADIKHETLVRMLNGFGLTLKLETAVAEKRRRA